MNTAGTFKLYINGEWISSESGQTFERVNPANYHQVLGKFQKGNEKDVDKAVDAAEKTFEKWSSTPAPKRGKILFKAAQLLEANKENVAKIMTTEMGKVLTESMGDVQEAIDMAYFIAGEGRRLYGYTTPSEQREKYTMAIRRPIGTVGLITPWNFPIAI